MPAITTERTIGKTKRAVLGGLIRYNGEKLGKQKYRRFAISLRDNDAIVGGIVGEVWMTVLFIQLFWIEERFRGKGHGTALMEKIEEEARRFGAVRSYLDTMSIQAPGFYRGCGYEEFGTLDGYPGGVTRHWFTKAL
ncbi:Acetyltransferase (GNAT) family protein [Bradyrhizobium lablabi]|uniref:Acetyltransferase (GNAT) family protein n=1 Tax=Bradyrhizobium lablabi TaxID=722472 RepID=A0A1M6TAZ7_9BRAD|nr:GNAT family N-acetyltransferase [Bradyrhizobium lablabi]SHK54151.1 Acetyltransferase (GNAT) family protein [Bradyrhizobium lablabi]